MLTLESLAFLMESMVHRVDGNFPHDVTFYNDNPEEDDGINVYYRDDEGFDGNIWIEEIVRVDDDGIIHCKDNHGEPVEVEIFERVSKSKILF